MNNTLNVPVASGNETFKLFTWRNFLLSYVAKTAVVAGVFTIWPATKVWATKTATSVWYVTLGTLEILFDSQ